MGLSWQQGPLSLGAIGRFLTPEPLPKKLLYAEPLRRRMRVRFGGVWIAESENVVLLFEPGRYPMAYFPKGDISAETLERTEYTTQHPNSGLLRGMWFEQEGKALCATRGNRPSRLSTRASCRNEWPSPARPWTTSMKKTNESCITLPIATIGSISDKLPAIWLFVTMTGS